MAARRAKRSARLRVAAASAAAVSLLASCPSTSAASFLTAPLEALRARALGSTVVPNVKATVAYSNASHSLPSVVDATNQGRYGHSAVYLPPPTNELLLIGGQVGDSGSGTQITNEVLRFRVASSFLWGDRPMSAIPDNPAKDAALAKGLPATAWGAATVDAQGRTWVVGGVTEDCDKDAIAHVLARTTNSSSSSASAWTVPALSPRYPPRRRQASALAVANATTGGTDVWVFGGIADQFTCSSETIGYAGIDRYDTVSGIVESMPWDAPGTVPPSEWEPPVSDYAAVVLDDAAGAAVGVLVIGGQGSDGHLADTAEVLNFDLASRAWFQQVRIVLFSSRLGSVLTFPNAQTVSNLAPAPRTGHAAVRLSSGSILIHGGFSSAHTVLSDLFLLSPSTAGWTWTQLVTSDHSEASPALAYHTATEIAGGTIVVAFGIDGKTSAPSSSFWFLTVDEDAGTYTWVDTFDGNAEAVGALEAADASTTAGFVAKLAKKTVMVIANPKANSSSSAAPVQHATAAASLGSYGPAESEAPISVPSPSSARAASSSAATAVKSPSSSASSKDAEEDTSTPTSTIVGASLGAVGAVAAAGLLFFFLRRRAAQGARSTPSTPVIGSSADGSAPFVSQLMYTRRAQARNMSLGSTLSALSPRAESLPSDSPNMAGVGVGGVAGTLDPFNDSYRVTEVGQLERSGSGASGSSTGGVVGAIVSSMSGLVGGTGAPPAPADTYTAPAPTLSAKRSDRRTSTQAPAPRQSLPVPGTPAELIGMAITSDDGHDGLPYLPSSAGAGPSAAGSAAQAWDPAVAPQRPFSRAVVGSTQREVREVASDASPVPAILRPGTPLRVANPDPFADQ